MQWMQRVAPVPQVQGWYWPGKQQAGLLGHLPAEFEPIEGDLGLGGLGTPREHVQGRVRCGSDTGTDDDGARRAVAGGQPGQPKKAELPAIAPFRSAPREAAASVAGRGAQQRDTGEVGAPGGPASTTCRSALLSGNCGREKAITGGRPQRRAPMMKTSIQPGCSFARTTIKSRPLLSNAMTSSPSAWPVSLIATSQAATPPVMAAMTRGNGVRGDQS